MTISRITRILLIVIPIAFNLVFFLLQRRFEYPDIVREPTDYISTRFRAGGNRLVALWYVFMFTGILFMPVSILVPQMLAPGNAVFVAAAVTTGVLAGLVQVLGLIRWPFVVRQLAHTYADPNIGSSPITRRQEAGRETRGVEPRSAGGAPTRERSR